MVIQQYRVKVDVENYGPAWLRWTTVNPGSWASYVADAKQSPDRFEVRELMPVEPVRELLTEIEARALSFNNFDAVSMRARFYDIVEMVTALRKKITQ